MRAGQRISNGNNQVLLFPLNYMNISQDEYGVFSHAGIIPIDFVGWGPTGRIYNCEYYAPCDLKLVYQKDSSTVNIWESINEVYLADGSTSYISLMVVHDNNYNRYNVGDIVRQGDLLGKTGTGGYATGDHVHINVGRGKYVGQEQIQGNWQLINSLHLYNAMFVNDTTIINGENHPWKIYDGPIPPEPSGNSKRNKFKWVLYANKIRNKCMR